MEIVRQKNVATYIVFPLVDADGDVVTGATSLDSEIDTWTDGAAPDGFADCTNEATEIGTTGVYYLSLTQTEMNNDYIYVQVKSSAKTQHIIIRTMVGDPLNLAVTDDGTAINVASGIVEAQVKSIDNNAITAASIATGAIDADAIADNAIDAGAIAADAITAAKVAADVSAEIADAVWDEDATGHQTGGTFGQAIGDPGADTNTIFKAVVTDASGATVGADTSAILEDTGTTLQGELDGIQADTEDIQSRLPAALTADGNIKADTLRIGGTLQTGNDVGADVNEILTDTGTTLQAELDGIQADTEDIQSRLPAALSGGRIDAIVGAMSANVVNASALAADAANEIADALLDRSNGIETSYTLRQALRLILSAVAAKLSGAATTTVAIRDVGDTKDRITATVDADGNRSAVTLDAT